MQVNNIEKHSHNSNLPLNQLKQNRHGQQNNQQQNFTGALDVVPLALRFLDTSPAWGASMIDVSSMVLPRTIVDFQRGPDAGMETAVRESSSSVNHAMVGVYGGLMGLALANGFNNKFGIKFNKIFAGDKILENLGQSWHDEVKAGNKDPLRKHLEKVVATIEGFDPSKSKDGWIGLSKENQKLVVDRLEKDIRNSDSGKISKDTEKYLHNIITTATGAESKMRLNVKGKEAVTGLDLKTTLENIYSVTKSFTTEKVSKAFEAASDIKSNDFIKSMKKFNTMRSLAGVALGATIGMSIQPINMYITKKRTGQDKFVGGGEKDDSFAFKMRKSLVAGGFITGALASITTKPKELIPALQFRGMVPSINQFKAIYGLTIMSRFLSARNDNELRECCVKDIIGFTNWLILGNVVTKAVANKLDKDLINITDENKGKGFFKWLNNSSVKTRDEVLLTSLKKHGVETIKDGKALSYSEMLKKLPSADKLTKVKLRKLDVAQVAGYLYSGLVLGVALPKLNAYMTKTRMEKQAKLEAEKAQKAGLEPKKDTSKEIVVNSYFKEQMELQNFMKAS